MVQFDTEGLKQNQTHSGHNDEGLKRVDELLWKLS